MTINDAKLQFNGSFSKRMRTTAIIMHHSGVNVLQSVQTIHNYYLHKVDPDKSTYVGIGYHYYIRKNGEIWRGRPEAVRGGHAGLANDYSIGVCCEGDFTKEKMSVAQYNSLIDLTRDIIKRNGKLDILKHSDVMPTSCPGGNYPFDTLKNAVLNPPKPVAPVPVVKPAPIPVISTIKVGSKVKMTGKKYATGQNIPLWAKLRTYDVLDVSSTTLLVGIGKAVTGWIRKSECKVIKY